MYYAGIDIGSESTDVVIVNENLEIVSEVIEKTGANHMKISETALKKACDNINCKIEDLQYIVGTGYGRKNIKYASKNITEITCHAKGAYNLNNKCRIIIDIGGQDSKVIKLGINGKVFNFLMNEKCAAGTGRFLEVMSRVLNVDLNDFGKLSLTSKEDVKLSSMCAVFAESEVISKIAEGKKVEDIINGIHNSICNRIVAMVEKIGCEEGIVMTGGVANNKGIIKVLENRLRTSIYVPCNPQIVGAYGAAISAVENSGK